nr:hypothetical protein [Tanacetum cinerariifolium]
MRLQADRLPLILKPQSGMFSIISIGYMFVTPENIAIGLLTIDDGVRVKFFKIQPNSVAAPVQTEHSDNERRDDHLNDDENNAVEDDP